jgi:hypothetical protein
MVDLRLCANPEEQIDEMEGNGRPSPEAFSIPRLTTSPSWLRPEPGHVADQAVGEPLAMACGRFATRPGAAILAS